jgi:hypothetical protein
MMNKYKEKDSQNPWLVYLNELLNYLLKISFQPPLEMMRKFQKDQIIAHLMKQYNHDLKTRKGNPEAIIRNQKNKISPKAEISG